MAFTTSSTIESVRVSFLQSSNRVTKIRIIFDGANPSPAYKDIRFTDYRVYPSDLDDLTKLQTIYASSDGIENVDGDSVVVELTGFPFGTSLEDLEKHGYWNPLDADSWDRFLERHKSPGLFTRGLGTIVTAPSGREEVHSEFGDVPQRGKPAGVTYELSGVEAKILVRQINSTRFEVAIGNLRHREIGTSDAEINSVPETKFVREWLDAHLDTGNSPGGNLFPASSIGGNRVYDVQGQIFNVFSATKDTLNGFLNEIEVFFDLDSSSPNDSINAGVIRSNIQTESYTITTTGLQVDPVRGAFNVAHRLDRLFLDSDLFLLEHNSVPTWFLEDPISDRNILVPSLGNFTAVVDYNDLAVIAGQPNRKALPPWSLAGIIHFTSAETATGNLRIQDLFPLLPSWQLEREYRVHNKHATLMLNIRNRDDGIEYIVKPGEDIVIRISLNEFGVGEVVLSELEDRFLKRSDSGLGSMNLPWWTTTEGSNNRLRWMRSSLNNQDLDPEAFSVGTRALPGVGNSSQGVLESVSDAFDYIGSVEILLNGKLHIEYDMTLELDSNAGTIPNNNGLRIFRRTAAGVISRIWNGTRGELSGAESRAQYTAIRVLNDVSPGDRILFFFKYNTGGSGNWGNIDVDNASLIMELSPVIVIEYPL